MRIFDNHGSCSSPQTNRSEVGLEQDHHPTAMTYGFLNHVVEQDLLVVNERVHEEPLLDEALPLWLLPLQVTVGVVGHDDAVGLVRQLDDEAVVVADHSLSSYPS